MLILGQKHVKQYMYKNVNVAKIRDTGRPRNANRARAREHCTLYSRGAHPFLRAKNKAELLGEKLPHVFPSLRCLGT